MDVRVWRHASARRSALVIGDEELLVARGVAAAVAAAARPTTRTPRCRSSPAAELIVGDLLAAVSPSLFGGGRVVVVRDGQDAKKDLAAALLAYAAAPEPDVVLVRHPRRRRQGQGARRRAARGRGRGHQRRQDHQAPGAGRLRPRRDPPARRQVRRGRGRGAARRGRQRPAGAGRRLLAAGRRHRRPDRREHVARYYRGRAEVSGFTVADAAMVGDLPAALEALRWALQVGVDPVPIADALADGVRTVARVASAGRGNAVPARQLRSACRRGRSNGRSGRPAAGRPSGWSEATKVAAECNAPVKGGSDDRGYALERAVFELVAARGTAGERR